jgi:hypothetical protein
LPSWWPLSDGWWLVDPTGLAPIEGLVRIACGRDAADIAFLSTQGTCEMVRQSITAEAEDDYSVEARSDLLRA